MPYTGPDDDKLPSNVQKLDKPAREKWVKTWNSTFENCRKDSVGGGAGSVEKCEADAFKFANGTIKKEAAVDDDGTPMVDGNPPEGEEINSAIRELTAAEKAHKMSPDMVEGHFQPLGGSQTYDEADAFIEAQEQAFEVNKVTWTGQDLIGNVMSDPDVENRPNKLQKVVDGMRARLSQALSKTADKVAPAEGPPEKEMAKIDDRPFQIIKAKDGSLRWIGIPTNKWRDRDVPAQIISDVAHREFVEHLDKTKDFPVLLSWHTPGTRLGIADVVDYSHGFLVMGGPIDKDKYAEAERLAEKCQAEDIGMSHGFVYKYSDKENEVIGEYRMWEVSHLPTLHAANVWTSIGILNKEVSQMSFNPEKREYLVGLHGEDIVAGLESKAADLEKDLVAAGIENKDVLAEPPDESAITEAAVKAIVENPDFKALIAGITTQTEAIEAQTTAIKAIEERVAAVEVTANGAEAKAQTTTDKIISDAMGARSASFQASQKGPEPIEEEANADPGPAAPLTGFQPGMMEHLTAAPLVENQPAVPVS